MSLSTMSPIVGDNGDNSTDPVSHVPHESQHSDHFNFTMVISVCTLRLNVTIIIIHTLEFSQFHVFISSITQYTSTLYIGIAQVTKHQPLAVLIMVLSFTFHFISEDIRLGKTLSLCPLPPLAGYGCEWITSPTYEAAPSHLDKVIASTNSYA